MLWEAIHINLFTYNPALHQKFFNSEQYSPFPHSPPPQEEKKRMEMWEIRSFHSQKQDFNSDHNRSEKISQASFELSQMDFINLLLQFLDSVWK